MNNGPRLVAIGGDAAGTSAASQARRRGPKEPEILALERGTYTSYAACGIPYLIGRTVSSPQDLIVRDPETFMRDLSIQGRTETTAADIDIQEQTR